LGKPAARKDDLHTCPVATPVPHAGGPITGPGCTSVLIGGKPAARVGDKCTCSGAVDIIVTGSSGVFIGGKPAARMGDITAHGGVIVGGCGSVLIGETAGNDFFLKPDMSGESTPDDFVMPSEEEKVRIIYETIQVCIVLLQKKLVLLKMNDARTLKQFKKWFGSIDEVAKQIIINRIERELNFFESLTEHDFEDLQDERYRRKTYAMAYPEDEMHTILLGDRFWSAGINNNISSVNVLIHEISHFYDIGNTRDFDYGFKQCLHVAKNIPEKALYNADSFAFFIES
jgi:uncharacterized Zn-binding protein involved in type VI secretion